MKRFGQETIKCLPPPTVVSQGDGRVCDRAVRVSGSAQHTPISLPLPSPPQVSSESPGGTFIYQGSVKGQGFGQFGFQRLGN